MPLDLKTGIVRILNQNGRTAGAGFVASADGFIATCAHVVEACRPSTRQELPETVRVVFLATGDEREVRVLQEYWLPQEEGDVAILQLEGQLPEGVQHLPLGPSAGTQGYSFRAYGFPGAKTQGLRAGGGTVVDVLGGGEERAVVQLRSTEVTQGFSGAPVWNDQIQRVIGLISDIAPPDRYDRGTQTAFATPTETLHNLCPLLHVEAGSHRVGRSPVEAIELQTLLTADWFHQHLDEIVASAGPRYTPELNIDVPVAEAIETFGRTQVWENLEQGRRHDLEQLFDRWNQVRTRAKSTDRADDYPSEADELGHDLSNCMRDLIGLFDLNRDRSLHAELVGKAEECLALANDCHDILVQKLHEDHGPSAVSSPGFRQFMAEYQMSFPARHVDAARDIERYLVEFYEWVQSDWALLPLESSMLISGSAGVGKTHAICDAALQRHRRGLRSIVLLGAQFSQDEPWLQIRTLLGMSGTISRNSFLDALNEVGKETGYPLIVFIDAINETDYRKLWKTHLAQMIQQIERLEWIKICVSCRTSYLEDVLPSGLALTEVIHTGFEEIDFDAYVHFFDFYQLDPPASPILRPEFANPLFLRLLCESLQSRGQRRYPGHELSLREIIELLFASKNSKIAELLDFDPRDGLVQQAMNVVVREMSRTGVRWLSWHEAKEVVETVRFSPTRSQSLFDQLFREGLLIEDRVFDSMSAKPQDVVRISFERLGDYLLAEHLLTGLSREQATGVFLGDGVLHFVMEDDYAIHSHQGLIEALAVLFPEQFELELFELETDPVVGKHLIRATAASLTWRDASSITHRTGDILAASLHDSDLLPEVMESLLAVCTRVGHPLNAMWFHGILSQITMPDRDSLLCPYLHDTFDRHGGIDRLIRWALKSDLAYLSTETAELWSTQLAWFTMASDRRVRDHATKAMLRLLDHRPKCCSSVLTRFLEVDDEYVIERCLAACYGALVRCSDNLAIQTASVVLWETYYNVNKLPANAMVRDYARLIMELALHRGVLTHAVSLDQFRPPYQSEWPLAWPSKESLKRYDDMESYPRLYASCIDQDFASYTVPRGVHRYSQKGLGSSHYWILKHVIDMGYTPERFARFDQSLLADYGGGRRRAMWAERIGKKYQWIALYRLVARMADHMSPDSKYWDAEPDLDIVPALQAQSLRDIDPTIWIRRDPEADFNKPKAWTTYPFDATATMTNAEWVDRAGFPDSTALIYSPQHEPGTGQYALSATLRWVSRTSRDQKPYRLIDLYFRSYLVKEEDVETCWSWAATTDFARHSLLEGVNFSRCYLGEYPWAAPAVRQMAWYQSEPGDLLAPIDLLPTSNRIFQEYEFDAYTGSDITMIVPSSPFFNYSNLEWNGRGGYRCSELSQCIQNLDVEQPGPSAMLVSAEYLCSFLEDTKMVVLWIACAEKHIIQGYPEEVGFATSSRVHMLQAGKLLSSEEINNRVQ